jgi:hypothetical protein
MIVSDQVRKCVAFVAIQTAEGAFRLVGSGFFLGRETEGDRAHHVRFVTARHVIDGIRRLALTKVYLRVNRTEGEAAWMETNISNWFQHPTDTSIDVAMIPCGIPEECDHVVVPFSLCATQRILQQHEVGLGAEVFITGLFRHHHGNQRNIPIVRVGNIACLIEEKIQTKDFGEIDAYLIEARSIGGLSGSPVFVNLGTVRWVNGQLKFSKRPAYFLFGLIHGHYDVSAMAVNGAATTEDNVLTTERVNTGIAIVVPFDRIEEVYKLSAPT